MFESKIDRLSYASHDHRSYTSGSEFQFVISIGEIVNIETHPRYITRFVAIMFTIEKALTSIPIVEIKE